MIRRLDVFSRSHAPKEMTGQPPQHTIVSGRLVRMAEKKFQLKNICFPRWVGF